MRTILLAAVLTLAALNVSAAPCGNCAGKGFVEGKIDSVPCSACEGYGVTPAAAKGTATTPIANKESPPVIVWPSYPTRPVGTNYWNMGHGRQITAEHLAGGHHSHERFDYQWLKTLSNAQLTALGSDSHEGNDKFREQFIVRRDAQGPAGVNPQLYSSGPMVYRTYSSSGCPNGNCPNMTSSNMTRTYSQPVRRSLFRGRR